MWPFDKKEVDYSKEPTKSDICEYRIVTHVNGKYALEYRYGNHINSTWQYLAISGKLSILINEMRKCIAKDNFKSRRIL